jgi:hypothetical protein
MACRVSPIAPKNLPKPPLHATPILTFLRSRARTRRLQSCSSLPSSSYSSPTHRYCGVRTPMIANRSQPSIREGCSGDSDGLGPDIGLPRKTSLYLSLRRCTTYERRIANAINAVDASAGNPAGTDNSMTYHHVKYPTPPVFKK